MKKTVKFKITNKDTAEVLKDRFDKFVFHLFWELEEGEYELEIRSPKRTNSQNKAIHLYCEMVATALNDSGIDKKVVLSLLKESIPWSKETVKEDLWKNFQKYMGLGVKTSKLKTNEVSQIYDLVNRFLSEKLKLDYIPFPNEADRQLLNS